MEGNPEISIIIPYGYYTPDIESTLNSTGINNDLIEIIIVTNGALKKELAKKYNEQYRIIESEEVGRGYFCRRGAQNANGLILLFLHADTTLPKYWFHKVSDAMSDSKVSGGGFTTSFRTDQWFIRKVPKLYNMFSILIGEYWGDRALFMRKENLISNLDQINIPIMEDVEMSKIIRKNGKFVLLSDVVSTSALHFTIKGYFVHIVGAVYYRILYAFGISPNRIFKWYYSQFPGNS